MHVARVGGGGSEHLTSLSVSCAICPEGFTSKLLVSSDFLPPLQLTKLNVPTSRSKETGESSFSFEAMIRWARLRCAFSIRGAALVLYGRTVTFVPTCTRNHGDVCVSCPRQRRFQDQEMDEREETGRTTALSWRENLSRVLRMRSNRVSGTPDATENNESMSTATVTPATDVDNQFRRRNSNVDFPIEYVPQFETNEIRVTNEECPRMETEPAFTDIQFRIPPSVSTASGRTVRSTVSQIIPNTENRFRTLFRVWDTRLSMKLFGSQNGIRKEEERRKNCKHWIIHPCSKFR